MKRAIDIFLKGCLVVAIFLMALTSTLGLQSCIEDVQAAGKPGTGQNLYSEALLLNSGTTKTGSSFSMKDDEYFGFDIVCDDVSGDAVNASIALATSEDDSNFVTATQTMFYSTTAAAAATLSMSTENHYHASIQPPPFPYIRFIITDAAAQADVTCTVKVWGQ